MSPSLGISSRTILIPPSPYQTHSTASNLILFVVVCLVIPEKSLVPVTPEEILASDVLVWIFWSLLQRRHVLPMRPMLMPKVVGIDRCNDKARNRHVNRQLAPKIRSSSSMVFHGLSLAIEGIILCSVKSRAFRACKSALKGRTKSW